MALWIVILLATPAWAKKDKCGEPPSGVPLSVRTAVDAQLAVGNGVVNGGLGGHVETDTTYATVQLSQDDFATLYALYQLCVQHRSGVLADDQYREERRAWLAGAGPPEEPKGPVRVETQAIDLVLAPSASSGELTCTVTGTSAPTYSWEINGVPFPAATNTLRRPQFRRDDTVRCSVVVDGELHVSNPVRVLNAPPVVEQVAIAPQTVMRGTPSQCDARATDPDQEAPKALAWRWTVNGVEVSQAASLDGSLVQRGDTVVCAASLSDGTAVVSAESAPVVVSNAPPLAPVAGLSTIEGAHEQGVVPRNATLWCRSTVPAKPDPDGDSVRLVYSWLVNGKEVFNVADSAPSGSMFAAGERVACRVATMDALGAMSPWATSDSLTMVEPGLLGKAPPPPSSSAVTGPRTVRLDVHPGMDVVLIAGDITVRDGELAAPGAYQVLVDGVYQGKVTVQSQWRSMQFELREGEPRFTARLEEGSQ